MRWRSHRWNQKTSSSRAPANRSGGESNRQRSRRNLRRIKSTTGRTVRRTSSPTARKGLDWSPSLTEATCIAAAVAASASSSHRALETDAAAATIAPHAGKETETSDWTGTETTSGSTSTTAAVAAAHSPAIAEVKGRIDPARAPWFA